LVARLPTAPLTFIGQTGRPRPYKCHYSPPKGTLLSARWQAWAFNAKITRAISVCIGM